MKNRLSNIASRATAFLGRHRVATSIVVAATVALGSFGFASAEITAGGATFDFITTWSGVNVIIGLLAMIFDIIGAALGSAIVYVISMLISILQYNSFGQSFIVELGWPIVRDLVNMSIIVIILLIAVRTMLGMSGGAQGAQQQLPRLFIAVVAVNFSKTITLFLIDISQVVMFTFVNALDVAAGNFVELFQLNAFGQSGLTNTLGAIGTGTVTLNATSYLIVSYLKVVMLGIVLMTMFVMMLIFIYRVIVLWILVILSPAAYFLMGIKSIVPGISSSVDQWQSKLVGALTVGPILCFFLWLALAASSQGRLLAETEGIDLIGSGELPPEIVQIFDLPNLMSLAIGIGLLFVGMQMAASSAGALGGFAGAAITKLQGASKALAIKSATVPAKFLGTQALTRTGAAGAIGETASRAGAYVQSSRIPFAGDFGRAISSGAASISKVQETANKVYEAPAEARVKDMSDDEFIGRMEAFSDKGRVSGQFWSEATRAETDQVAWQILTNKDREKAYKKSLKDQGLSDLEVQRRVDEKKKTAMDLVKEKGEANFIGGDKDKKKQWYEAQVRNMHLIDDKKEIQELVDDDDFRMSMLNKQSAANEHVQDALKEKVVDIDRTTGRKITAYEEGAAGKGVSRDVQDAINGRQPAAKLTTDEMKGLGKEFVGGLSDPRNRSKVKMLARALMAGKNSVSDITPEVYNSNVDNIQEALLETNGEVDLSTLDATIRGRVETALATSKTAAIASGDTIRRDKASAAMYRLTNDINVSFGINPTTGVIPADSRASFERTMRANPDMLEHPDIIGAAAVGGSDLAAVIATISTKETVKALKREFELARTTTQRDSAKVRIQTIRDAASGTVGKPARTLETAADAALRVM